MPSDANLSPQKLRRDADLKRCRLPELGPVKIERAQSIVLRGNDPVELKFCEGYAHPGLVDAKP